MMDDELRKMIDYYFDASDLVEFLGLSAIDIVDNFPKEIEDALDDIKDMIGLREEDGEEDD